jgi:predicted O-methyltransferase YrrM
VEAIIARGYARIVNIGAADGYYAIGLARRMPNTVVEAYEALEEHHPLLKRAAERNGVADRVRMRGLCTVEALDESLGEGHGRTLVLADIEGAEMLMLDPVKAPNLSRTDMLVETHDVLQPGCTDSLIQRFSESHLIERISTRPRALADFPRHLIPRWAETMPALLVELMSERRKGEQEWLFLTAKA